MPGLFFVTLTVMTAPSIANLKFVSLGSSTWSEFRIRSHTSKRLNLVWFTVLEFLNVNATQMVGTANPPRSCDAALQQ